MRRIVVGVTVLVLGLLVPPADAQVYKPDWPEEPVEVSESAGEVVLTLRFDRPGRIRYQSFDWAASDPEDYTAVSGEFVFAGPGSRTIRIPIVNDALDEGGDELFIVNAWEEPTPDPWPSGDQVSVFIVDDDVHDGGAATTTAPPASSQPPSAEPILPPIVPPTPPPGDVPLPEVPVEVVPPALDPGPGFELTGQRAANPAPAQDRGGSGSAWVAPGLGTAAAGLAAAVLVRRRTRWSPSHP